MTNPTNKPSADDELRKAFVELLKGIGVTAALDSLFISECLELIQADREKRELLDGKNHDHQFSAFQCEEGCGCDYIHLQCLDDECSFYAMADGWDNCNVDHNRVGKKRELEAKINYIEDRVVMMTDNWKSMASADDAMQLSIDTMKSTLNALQEELKKYE